MNEGLAQLSNNLVYSALAVYAVAMVAYAAEAAFGSRSRVRVAPAPAGAWTGSARPAGPPSRVADADDRVDRLGRIATSVTALAFGLHLAAAVTRGLAAGRVPWGNMYEFSLVGALAVAGAYLFLLRRYALGFLGVVIVPTVLLTLGLAITVLYTDAGELVPALKSVWLVIHVVSAVVSAGVFTVGAALSALYLLKARAERRSSVGGWTGRMPSAAAMDRLAYKLHAFVFPLWTFAVVSGAIWAENAWGRYWGWDPKEVWAFITWVVYAGYLHARATAGWRGSRAAWISLAGFAALTFNYFGVNIFIPGLHSYAGV